MVPLNCWLLYWSGWVVCRSCCTLGCCLFLVWMDVDLSCCCTELCVVPSGMELCVVPVDLSCWLIWTCWLVNLTSIDFILIGKNHGAMLIFDWTLHCCRFDGWLVSINGTNLFAVVQYVVLYCIVLPACCCTCTYTDQDALQTALSLCLYLYL